jgi:uncharacterized protein (TIGR00251 family)
VIQTTTGGVFIMVKVIPRSGRSGVAGTRDGAILVTLNAPPVEGAANTELIGVLAKTLGVARRDVEIVSGEKARRKRVRVAGITESAAAARLANQPG